MGRLPLGVLRPSDNTEDVQIEFTMRSYIKLPEKAGGQ